MLNVYNILPSEIHLDHVKSIIFNQKVPISVGQLRLQQANAAQWTGGAGPESHAATFDLTGIMVSKGKTIPKCPKIGLFQVSEMVYLTQIYSDNLLK